MTMAKMEFIPDDIHRAINKINSLRDGDIGVIEAVSCGRRAIPALRSLLFAREPSGIYQPRCWAAHALSMLGAFDVLFEFLQAPHGASDPVERAGDEAVINAVARYLSTLREEPVFQLLLDLTRHKYYSGVIAALATFQREEAIPYLVRALGEDDCRLLAEPALVNFGTAALPALLGATRLRVPPSGKESETSIRKRQSALRLVLEIGVPLKAWSYLRGLVLDPEPRIAVLASELCLMIAPEEEWPRAVRRLVRLLAGADWRLESDIEDCLIRRYSAAKLTIAKSLRQAAGLDVAQISPAARTVLLRVRDRAAKNKPRRYQ
jgi:hypothetical protein